MPLYKPLKTSRYRIAVGIGSITHTSDGLIKAITVSEIPVYKTTIDLTLITDTIAAYLASHPTTPYSLPIADADILGGIKVGNNLSIDANGVLSAAADLQALELAAPWKTGNNLYQEFVLTGADITQINYWKDATKAVKLFTKDITYVLGNPTVIVMKDETTLKILTTTIAYTGTVVTSITKTIA